MAARKKISVTMKTQSGGDAGTAELVDTFFGVEPNLPVMHQVVTAQLAARRDSAHQAEGLAPQVAHLVEQLEGLVRLARALVVDGSLG